MMTKDELLLKASEAAQGIDRLKWALALYATQIIDAGYMTNRALADELNVNEKTLSEYVNVHRYYGEIDDSELALRIADLRESPVLTYSHWRDARKLKRLHPSNELLQVETSVAFLEEVADNAIKVTPARLEIDALLAGVPFVPMSIRYDSRDDEGKSYDYILSRVIAHGNQLGRDNKRFRVVVYELGSED